jgi:hypothetical protein
VDTGAPADLDGQTDIARIPLTPLDTVSGYQPPSGDADGKWAAVHTLVPINLEIAMQVTATQNGRYVVAKYTLRDCAPIRIDHPKATGPAGDAGLRLDLPVFDQTVLGGTMCSVLNGGWALFTADLSPDPPPAFPAGHSGGPFIYERRPSSHHVVVLFHAELAKPN